MANLSILSIFTVFLTILISCTSAADVVCQGSLEKVDKCYTSIHVIGDRNFVRPRTLSAVKGHCKVMKRNLKCVKEYAKCLKPLPKTMYGILHAGMKKEVNKRCISDESRKEFLKHVLLSEPTKPTYDGIFFKLVNFYDFTTKNMTNEMQLPHICCGFQYILREMFDSVTKGNSEETAKYFDRSIKNMWGDIIDFACGKFSDVKICQKELPDAEILYNNQPTNGSNGILVPLIRFTKTLI